MRPVQTINGIAFIRSEIIHSLSNDQGFQAVFIKS